MGNSSDEETTAGAKTRRKFSSVVFADRAHSSTTVYTRRDSIPADSEVIEDGDADTRKLRTLTRSRSEDVTPRVREQWGNELWNQGALKESVTLLRSSVAEYEKEASQQQWKDLLKINADVADFGKLARTELDEMDDLFVAQPVRVRSGPGLPGRGGRDRYG